MNIGDRVRLIHGREEGVIVGFTRDNLIEVEIEDGFRIPVVRSEIVVVSPEEAARFRRDESAETASPAKPRSTDALAEHGVYLAFVPVNDTTLALYLLNNTDFDMPYTLGQEQNGRYQALKGGTLGRKSSVKVDEYGIGQFENWGVFVWQALYFREGMPTLRQPETQRVRFRANTFFKNKTKAPLLGKDAHLFQLDAATTTQPVAVQPEKIVESWENNRSNTVASSKAQTQPVARPAAEVDLHIERLTNQLIGLANADMLRIQLEAFEKALDGAVAHGMGSITFIHGVGNGTLRTEIHRRLSRHIHVKFYEDAQKEKFGYGATKVTLK
ncbi:MAG: DUF2027 domain-containing protein [Cytophagales bacterium]|jgi:hypothetical protein|nr:DUF2027 domain-containing protein [Cytophagales bacterium]